MTPSMALEIGDRAGLPLQAYWLLQPRGNRRTGWLHRLRAVAGLAESELFTTKFLYLYSPALVT